MKRKILAVLCALALVFSAAVLAETSEATPKPQIFDTIDTTDIYGGAQTEALLENAPITFFNVWATYCGPCLEEMPDLAELAGEYEGKVQFVGIVSDVNYGQGVDEELVKLAAEIAEETGANYTHLIPSDAMNQRVLGSITAVPTSFILDKDGRQVGKAFVGAKDKDGWKQVIDEALALVQQ